MSSNKNISLFPACLITICYSSCFRSGQYIKSFPFFSYKPDKLAKTFYQSFPGRRLNSEFQLLNLIGLNWNISLQIQINWIEISWICDKFDWKLNKFNHWKYTVHYWNFRIEFLLVFADVGRKNRIYSKNGTLLIQSTLLSNP